MNAKKKIVSVALAASLAATAIVGGTLAYFTDTDKAINNFSVGNVDIVVEEPHWNPDNAVNMYPGQVVEKDPVVTNEGNNPAFVRVKVEYDRDVVTLFSRSAEWKYNEADGYYYYATPVAAGETTTPVFEKFILNNTVENDPSHAEQYITVSAEAVQSQGSNADTVEEIAAWFGTCGMNK